MGKWIKYLVITFVLLFLMDKILGSILFQLKSNTYVGQSGGKINDFTENFQYANILAVGDSRCAHHVDPTILGKKTYNLSHNGMSLIFHTGLIDELLSANKNIKIDTLILNVSLKELTYPTKNHFNDIQFLKFYHGKNKWITKHINQIKEYEKYKFIFSTYSYNGDFSTTLLNSLFKKKSSNFLNGFTPNPESPRDSINVAWQLKRTNNKLVTDNFYVSKINQNYLLHISEICNKKGIKFICFASPTYSQESIPNKFKQSLGSFFKSNDIIFLDYSNAFYKHKELQNIWLWKDVFHLNRKGAKVFSNILRKDLNSTDSYLGQRLEAFGGQKSN